MILQLFGGLIVLAFFAGPGYIYERRVDERAPRHSPRSTSAENIERLITGSLTTLLALCVVLLVGGILQLVLPGEVIDLGKLFAHPGAYATEEPWRVAIGGIAVVVLSLVIADVSARIRYPESGKNEGSKYKPHTIWFDFFDADLPSGHSVSISIELLDGVQITGTLEKFTPTDGDDRELGIKPFVMRRPGQKAWEAPESEILLLRESQIKWLSADYEALPKTGASPTP